MIVVADFLPYLVTVWLVMIGLYGMATSRNLIHLVVCLSVFQASVWVLLLTTGFRREATAPIFDDVPLEEPAVDPVMQALSVTDVVVGAAVLAILLALAVQVHKRFGTLDPGELDALRG